LLLSRCREITEVVALCRQQEKSKFFRLNCVERSLRNLQDVTSNFSDVFTIVISLVNLQPSRDRFVINFNSTTQIPSLNRRFYRQPLAVKHWKSLTQKSPFSSFPTEFYVINLMIYAFLPSPVGKMEAAEAMMIPFLRK
jgi:hypothetical protein